MNFKQNYKRYAGLVTLFMCLTFFFVRNTAAQNNDAVPVSTDYTFEAIDVPGVDFLAVTASSDFENYAGYTKSADGEKDIAFTLIDGVFTRYDFPGAMNTYFYALGNNGNAAGHYEDSEGLYHGVVLENGELREYNFPDSVETEIYGISDATGALTGNFIDADGVRRGFSADTIIEVPGASATYSDFVNAIGAMVGSYVDAEGIYHAYVRTPDGTFRIFDISGEASELEYYFVHGINDARVIVTRSKMVGDVPRSYVGLSDQVELDELRFPGSVSTEGWNINQDGSIVGHYDTPDGRRHGFIARPSAELVAQIYTVPVVGSTRSDYTFESIDVPGVQFLELTASSDFEDYAGNTRDPDGEKMVAFTLIDGVFTTYHFPGARNTYFYALGNNGNAAGHYEDSEGLFHGVILENGELRQYDFPNAVQTEIYGISDATGALTGNFIDAAGVRRGFSGNTIIEVPGASATYADFANSIGLIVGSYADADGAYHLYTLLPDGTLIPTQLPQLTTYEYFFVQGINDAGAAVVRRKAVGDVPRTYAGSFMAGLIVLDTSTPSEFETFFASHELQFPGSVSTDGWNINQDGSVVGHYDTPDGRRHGFIARPVPKAESDHFGNVFNVTLTKGLNMLSVPLAPPTPMTAKSLVAMTGATIIITLDTENQRYVAWTPRAPGDGFPIEGGKGYIVNVPQTRNFAFVGAPWTDRTEAAAAPPAISVRTAQEQGAWAFVVSGRLEGTPAFDGYRVIVRNLRTNSTITAPVQGDYFAAATADLTRRSVIQAGDMIELHVIGPDGHVESETHRYTVSAENVANALLDVRIDGVAKPSRNQLLPNYPNPFNPETWIPYRLAADAAVEVTIYDTHGALVRRLELGHRAAGYYIDRDKAAYWDGRNRNGESVASGLYFYRLATTGESDSFRQLRRMTIVK